jgi:NAD+ kinase
MSLRSTTTSMPGSSRPSAEPVRRAAVVTHGKPETIGDAFARLERVAAEAGVELVEDGADELDLAVVLGGDGTMLRALQRFLGTHVPVIGVNFGRVGFLAAMRGEDLETGMRRVFAGEYDVLELPTLQGELESEHRVAVNDVVAASSQLGRMVELAWSVGGEDLGRLSCDGLIACTPSGSTAYNLSNGGPVLVWGLDAMAISFVAPHSLQARPLVVPPNRDLVVRNFTPDVAVTVLVDGHRLGDLGSGAEVTVRLGDQRTLLATLPEATFFRRYRETFAS